MIKLVGAGIREQKFKVKLEQELKLKWGHEHLKVYREQEQEDGQEKNIQEEQYQ